MLLSFAITQTQMEDKQRGDVRRTPSFWLFIFFLKIFLSSLYPLLLPSLLSSLLLSSFLFPPHVSCSFTLVFSPHLLRFFHLPSSLLSCSFPLSSSPFFAFFLYFHVIFLFPISFPVCPSLSPHPFPFICLLSFFLSVSCPPLFLSHVSSNSLLFHFILSLFSCLPFLFFLPPPFLCSPFFFLFPFSPLLLTRYVFMPSSLLSYIFLLSLHLFCLLSFLFVNLSHILFFYFSYVLSSVSSCVSSPP